MSRVSALRTGVLLAAAVAVGACSSTPAASKITDPKEIANKATASMADAKAIHATIAVSGTIKMDLGSLTGGSGSASKSGMDISGTKGEIWVDIPGKNAKMTFSAPALMNTAGEILVVDNEAYIKLTGPFASFLGTDAGKYLKTPLSDASQVADPSQAVGKVDDMLTKPGTNMTLAGTDNVNGRQSYHLKLDVPKDELNAGSSFGVTVTSASVDVWVAVDNQQVTRVQLQGGSTDAGDVTVKVDLDYPKSVDVKAPPADQVVTAPSN